MDNELPEDTAFWERALGALGLNPNEDLAWSQELDISEGEIRERQDYVQKQIEQIDQEAQHRSQEEMASQPEPPRRNDGLTNLQNLVDGHITKLTEKIDPAIPDHEAREDLRRQAVLAATIKGIRETPAPKPRKARAKSTTQAQVYPQIENLAIGKLLKARIKFKPEDVVMAFSEIQNKIYHNLLETNGCHFCVFDADWGVSDPSVQLPASVGQGYCKDDHITSSSFYQLWSEMSPERKLKFVPGDTKEEKEKRLKELENLTYDEVDDEGAANSQSRPTVISKIDGKDITRLMGYLFCKSCPWTQIDPTKTRTCPECLREKLLIICHGRHTSFLPIQLIDASRFYAEWLSFREAYREYDLFENDEEEMMWMERQSGKKRCMICLGHAVSICADCPLKVCSTCEVSLDKLCKGWLDNLIYHYGSERNHLRNDAFLLRSDNGGYVLD